MKKINIIFILIALTLCGNDDIKKLFDVLENNGYKIGKDVKINDLKESYVEGKLFFNDGSINYSELEKIISKNSTSRSKELDEALKKLDSINLNHLYEKKGNFEESKMQKIIREYAKDKSEVLETVRDSFREGKDDENLLDTLKRFFNKFNKKEDNE